MAIDTSNFKNGLSFELDNEIYSIIEFQHVKPGKGGAFVRTKLRNIKTGSVLDKTFRAGEKFEQAILERKTMQYLYNQDDQYFLMDLETYDQIPVAKVIFGDAIKYLKDNIEVTVMTHNDNIMGVELPIFIEAEIIETAGSERGNTASGGGKPATIETGAVIQVPFFINVGDKIKVDTRTDAYLERVNK